jgi:cyclopropane fatty-acyl-phospholipid synthase-like methyltransferase
MNRAGDKPFAAACERNREPILEVLRVEFAACRRILEIGSGTGQHAVHLARALPHLSWQSSERPEHLPGIRLWLDEAALPNTPAPIAFDVTQADWPKTRYDGIFTANTLHIMAWPEVKTLFDHLPGLLAEDARLAIYGPFNIHGRYTSESNAAFDSFLRDHAPHMGIRDLAEVDVLAARAGLRQIADYALPANNRCVIWRRETANSSELPAY